MGHNRGEAEATIRSHLDWVVFDGEYSVVSVIAEAIADWVTDGSYEELPENNAKSAAQKFGIDLITAMAQNGFNPESDTIYGGTMTFQNWQDLPGGYQLPLPNKFVPYIGVKKGQAPGHAPVAVGGFAAGPFSATVGLVRSFDGGIHLKLINGPSGWTIADNSHPMLLAVAAGAQGGSRLVWVQYESYDPNWGNGAGFFYNVRMAFNRDAFPG